MKNESITYTTPSDMFHHLVDLFNSKKELPMGDLRAELFQYLNPFYLNNVIGDVSYKYLADRIERLLKRKNI